MMRSIFRTGSLALAACLLHGAAHAADYVNVVNQLALRGYDPVAYFTQGKAVMGSAEFTATYMGATYDFASAEDKAAFAADPAKFVPQYGGFCAAATSHGRKVDADPSEYVVKDGKLYGNYNHEALEAFSKDLNASIKAADEKWPEVREIETVIR